MVTTFEFTSNAAARLDDAPDMRAASAGLPGGAYTTFRTYHGNRILRLAQHAQRLRESTALIGQAVDCSDGFVRDCVAGALRQAGHAESRLRLTLAPAGPGQSAPRLFVSVEAFTPYPARLYDTGVACITLKLQRDNPHAKSTAFIGTAGNAYAALPPGVHEGLLVTEDGSVLEGLSSNFFALAGGVLHTEQTRALVGVTQSLVLELAAARRPPLPVDAGAVKLAGLPGVSECFITSVSREVLPVVRIDQAGVGDGTPGPVTRQLLAAFRDLIEREATAV